MSLPPACRASTATSSLTYSISQLSVRFISSSSTTKSKSARSLFSVWSRDRGSSIVPSSSLSRTNSPSPLSIRTFSTSPNLSAPKQQSSKEKALKEKMRKRRKKHTQYKMPALKDLEQFALCDAVRYIKAFEVGRSASGTKYDLAVRLKTKKDGPVLRNQIRLPFSVKTDIRICVLCDPNSKEAKAAREAGASLVGDVDVIKQIKEGTIDFDRCIATPDVLPKLAKEGLPRILGPRGLMPSAKLGTVVDGKGLGDAVKNLLGGSTYRERQGVVRMSVGQLAFTPEMLRENVKALIAQIRKEASGLSDQVPKEVFEVVLSSTNSPGFSLNGDFKSETSPTTTELSVV